MSNLTAKAAPEFLKDSVIYQINLRTFTPDGTLRAAERLLPHIAALGADLVYLCPVTLADDDPRPEFWSDRQKQSGLNNPKNIYRVGDYYAVDPEYGTDDDLKSFVRTAHGLGLRVLLDLVYYHCGPSAAFLAEHPDFAVRDENGEIRNGHWHFPELNFASSGLREYLWRNMEYFVREFDVDGYRCDVAGAVPLDFWEEGRRRIDALKPGLVMLAESEGDRRDEQRAAFELNYGMTFIWSFPAVLRGEKPASALREAREQRRAEALPGARFLAAFDNHDLANDQYDDRIEKLGPERIEAALAFCFALDGVPLLYCGQEIADSHRHSIFREPFLRPRLVIDWSNAVTPAGERRMRFLKELIALRRRTPALTRGETAWLDNPYPDELLTFRRTMPAEERLHRRQFRPRDPDRRNRRRRGAFPWRRSRPERRGRSGSAAFRISDFTDLISVSGGVYYRHHGCAAETHTPRGRLALRSRMCLLLKR